MARVNVYLPDDLHEEVKQAGVEVSPVCQTALRAAVASQHRSKHQQLDLLRAAERIALTATEGPLRKAEGRKRGLQWAEDAANLHDLQALDELTVTGFLACWEGQEGGTNHLQLDDFETLEEWLLSYVDIEAGHHQIFLVDKKQVWDVDDFTEGFFEAAKEFWANVKPLLDQPESDRQQQISALQSDPWPTSEPPF